MESIYFESEEVFNSLSTYYSGGYESKLYRYSKDDSELLIKKYYNQDQINIEKIKRVSNLKTEELLKPKFLLNINGEIDGFAMDFVRGFYPLSVEKKDLNDLQKYNLIIKLKRLLYSLREEGCIYGDLNVNNILTDGNQVYLCDAVNVKVDEFSFDEISSTMHNYIDRTKTTDGIDIYMLNLLTVYLFNEIEYNFITENIELAITSMFNNQSFDYICGVTDSLDTLNMSFDIFLSDKVCDKLLIDYMNIDKDIDRVSKI